MTARVDLRLEGTLDHLRLAWQVGETLLNHVPFEVDPKATRYNFLLAVQELLTNVFRHGYASNEVNLVELRFEFSAVGFEVVIRDRARPFDPTVGEDFRRRDEDGTAMPGVEGGYGLVIVKAIMDELNYVHEDGWNVTRAFKSIKIVAPVGVSES